MFNKNFFWGVLTTLLVVVILGIGGLVAVRAFMPGTNTWAMTGGRPGRFEQAPGGEFQPGNPGGQGDFNRGGDRFDHQGRPGFDNDRHGGRAGFAPLHGIGGLLGSLFLIGVVVAAVLGGQKLFKRFRGRPTSPAAAVSPAPAAPVDEPRDFSEPATVEAPEVVEPAEPPVESPVEPPVAGSDDLSSEDTGGETTSADVDETE